MCYWFYKLISPLARIWLIRLDGIENVPNGPCIFSPNHPSYLDGVLLFYIINWKLKRHVHFYTWRLWWSFIYIQMTHGITLGGAVRKGVHTLKRGISLGIFPEGGRTFGKRLETFKTGAATTALLAGRPIIPIGITYERQRALRWRAIVRFGKPIKVKKYRGDTVPLKQRERLTGRLRREIAILSGLKR